MGMKNNLAKHGNRLGALLFAVAFLALSSCELVKQSSSSLGSSTSGTSASAESSSTSVGSSSASSSTDENQKMLVYALEQTGLYGDCTLFTCGDTNILIDGGNEGSASTLQTALTAHVTDHVLDLLVLTHPHDDHYGGFNANATLLNAGITGITTIVDSGADSYSSYYVSSWVNSVRKYWINKGSAYYPVEHLVDGTYNSRISFANGLSVTFLDTGNYTAPGGAASSDANPTSVALSLHYGKSDFVMVGDLPTDAEGTLMAKNPSLSAFIPTVDQVIYKAAHHGSNGANSAAFMSYLKPSYAWASAGLDPANTSSPRPSTAQHPYTSARARIEAYTTVSHLWWNGTSGTLDMSVTYGGAFSIAGEGRTTNYYSGGAIVDAASEKDTPLEATQWAKMGF
jgi:beta-lactamase superfamily II metal-dependent hydrolase